MLHISCDVQCPEGNTIVAQGYSRYSITECIKDLFKTSNGKYISPQALETKISVDRYIDQIAIIADQRKFVSALIIPQYDLLKQYADEKGIKYASQEELLQDPQIISMMKERIDTLQQQFAHYEQVKGQFDLYTFEGFPMQ